MKSKSKTQVKSKPSLGTDRVTELRTESLSLEQAPFLAVGHAQQSSLVPQDEVLFRAFQSNLLSLISHELRTPLMGILNALTVLSAEPDKTEVIAEWVERAQRNAEQLNQNLSILLDTAALESGLFHARLKEVQLATWIETILKGFRPKLARLGLRLILEKEGSGEAPILADPQKLSRVVSFCLEEVCDSAEKESTVKVRITTAEIYIQFTVREEKKEKWDSSWEEAMAGFKSRATSPGSLFSGVVQSEQNFLTRSEEGLGSGLLLVHEILKLHHGEFQGSRTGDKVQLCLILPSLSSEDGLLAVLGSRIQSMTPESGGLGSVVLALVRLPKWEKFETFCAQLRKRLFRASDSVYAFPERGVAAMILEDCKPEDAPRLLARLEKNLKKRLRFGVVSCPADSLDPKELLALAINRVRRSSRNHR